MSNPSKTNPTDSASTAQPNNNELLKAAWERQRAYSKNAGACQARFLFLRTLLVILGVVVIFLSVLQPQLVRALPPEALLLTGVNTLLLILPIVITALLAFAVKFDRGNNWLLLRGSSEALKMEIYYYRTRVGAYQENRDATLANKIKVISERLKSSSVHQAALNPYERKRQPISYHFGVVLRALGFVGKQIIKGVSWLWQQLFGINKQEQKDKLIRDDQFSDLKIENYLNYRLLDQFTWYRNKAQILDKQLQWLEAGIYIFGGIGTFLAASEGYKSWVAVTTAMTGALSNYLGFKQVEASLVGYNQAADALYDVYAWWVSLSPQQQQQPENRELLVVATEEIIQSEHNSWLQDMKDRLAKLYGTTEKDSKTSSENPATSELRPRQQ